MKVYLSTMTVLLFLSSSCNKKSSESMQNLNAKAEKIEISEIETKMNMSDCLSEFDDIERVINNEGKIVIVMDMAMISYKSSSRLNPCNIPDGFKEGDAVIFSGVIKESPKGVRLAGTPFKLTSIVKR